MLYLYWLYIYVILDLALSVVFFGIYEKSKVGCMSSDADTCNLNWNDLGLKRVKNNKKNLYASRHLRLGSREKTTSEYIFILVYIVCVFCVTR